MGLAAPSPSLLFISPHQKARRLAPQMSLRSLRKLDRGPGIDDG